MSTILIVDDLSADREFLVTQLRPQGHRLLQAANGREGLAAVQLEHPDLVITDMLMPVMDGYDFVSRLRLDSATNGIPVVFYTAPYGVREARALARSTSASYVLTKPAEPDAVRTIVARALARDAAPMPVDANAPATESEREHLRLLSDELSEKSGDLRAANVRLRALINIGLELASERDPDLLLESVCRAVRDLFGATYVTLGIVNLTDRTVQRVLTRGVDSTSESDAAQWIKIGDPVSGILGTVVANRRTLRGDNPRGHPSSLQLPLHHPEVQSFIAAPIASLTNVYGWLCLVGNEGRAFSEEDEQLVVALSGQVGRIYESSHFYAVATKRAQELEHEILERKQAQTAAQNERDRAQRYLDAADVILLKQDLRGRIMLVNRYACSILGWTAEELIGRDWIDTCLPVRVRQDAQTKLDSLLGVDLAIAESAVLTKSGAERRVEWRNRLLRDDDGAVVGIFSSGTDITERRALEAQYQQAQKTEAVGRLAGGVAHDFNNLLTVILGYCELLLQDLDPNDLRQADIVEIQRAGLRATGLTRQLLAFSRKQVIEPTLLDLNAVVGDMRPMLGRLIGEDVKVVLSLRPELSPVKADRGQVEQIVLNLAVNARDAMPNGGTLTIETANVDLDENYPKTHFAVKPGPYVSIIVTDTGAGITPPVMARLFEPFFTTKEPGKGTGLGLATVHGIVAQSGGSVSVYSEVGRGTSFKVYFPRAADGERAADQAPAAAAPRSGTQTVLVVEDAEELRELSRRLLERQGYTVLLAANADEALQLFEQNASIDVLLTDVVMPGASGPELTRQLVEERPALKVVYMSGYTEEAIVHHGILDPGIAFLHKPFTADALGGKIREVLAQPLAGTRD